MYVIFVDNLEPFEVPQKIKLLSEKWQPSTGLVTATMKLKRRRISAHYKDIIETLYSKPIELLVEQQSTEK